MSEIRDLFRQMLRIRMVEEAIADRYKEQEMRCPVHLSIGQEGPAAAFSLVASKRDYAVSTHRAHAHYLAKGGDLKAMVAELYGKVTGCSKGIGGSMHLAEKAVGFMGSSAIVGNSIPVGVGLGLSIQIRQTNALSWVFLGDAATEEGVYYESVNFSVLKKLPVLFMCENNGFSVYSDESVRRPPNQKIFEVAEFLGCKATQVDGNNPTESHRVVSEMADYVRSGGGPGLIEFHTFRLREHCGPNFDDHLDYRSPEYLARWRDSDPISLLGEQLQSASDAAWASSVREAIEVEIDDAFAAAAAARYPTSEECAEVLYAK